MVSKPAFTDLSADLQPGALLLNTRQPFRSQQPVDKTIRLPNAKGESESFVAGWRNSFNGSDPGLLSVPLLVISGICAFE